MQNRVTSIVLLICLLVAVSYSVMSLHQANKGQELVISSERTVTSAKSVSQSTHSIADHASTIAPHTQDGITEQKKTDTQALPVSISLLGVSLDRGKALCLLEVNGYLQEYHIGDLVDGYPIQVIEIKAKQVFLGYGNNTYTLYLSEPNLLAKQTQKSRESLLKMEAQEIGSRPQLVEHFVSLTATPYIADGMLASPGLNPSLFEQAGLVEDDVIKTINGKSVTILEEFNELQRNMRHADTLIIIVMRKGRQITLYLDIPAEALTLRP